MCSVPPDFAWTSLEEANMDFRQFRVYIDTEPSYTASVTAVCSLEPKLHPLGVFWRSVNENRW
jgi:hypothetical protein